MEKKEKIGSGTGCLYAAQNGAIIPLEQVPDKTFSEKLLGDGVAIIPSDGMVVSPAKGKIIVIAETKHACAIETDDGAELLIHIGLETVGLGGKGFESLVKVGDRVDVGMPICRIDRTLWDSAEKPLYTPLVITNSLDYEMIVTAEKTAKAGETCVIRYTRK
ncbi:MAG: PTS glucose transporter subunit IIA [Clostridiales bacterium]|nr:PTS glucose transporter subunit IIA [Clostridiales bacterium]